VFNLKNKYKAWWKDNPGLWEEWVRLCKELDYPVNESFRKLVPPDWRLFVAKLSLELRKRS